VRTSVLQAEQVTVRYGPLLAVDEVSVTAQAGAVTAVLGPNGAGKTSLIESCVGLRRPSSGTIRLLGSRPEDPRVRARTGVMLQSGGLYPTARPLEWLRYLARLYPQSSDPAAMLEQLGLYPGLRTPTRRLSGGQAQRVKLAAALIHRPEVLFLDEPTAGLDPLARHGLLELIREQRTNGVAIVLTTHLLADVEDLADLVVVLAGGRIHASGSIAELTEADRALRFWGPADLHTPSLVESLPAGHQVLEPTPGCYLVQGTVDPEVVAVVAAWCAQHGALAGGLRPGTRSLEDIVRAAAQPVQLKES